MLNLAKYCNTVIARNNIPKLVQSRQSMFSHSLKTILQERSLICVRSNPGWLRQQQIKSVRFSSQPPQKGNKAVGTWLFVCSGMVFVAVVLGGVTRLTESGLSMVTWKLLGEKRPITMEEWNVEFELYKQFPEYKMLNQNMTIEEFKRIWWMEYMHRQWGRLIGAVFAIPAAYFWLTGNLCPYTKKRVLALGLLIGLQGLMGWYMVKSGLENRFNDPSDVPRVSQYRLASHLGLAFIIYTGFLYSALHHLIPAQTLSTVDMSTAIQKLKSFKTVVYSSKGLVFLTALSGALVAGMDAGLIYNTFPKMADKWIPQDILALSPALKNFTENPTTVQFDHRVLGVATLSLITFMGIMSRRHVLPGNAKKAVAAALFAGYLQVALGISTLLHHVPISLAAFHQSGSLILLSTMVWLCHELKLLKHIPK